MLIYKLLLENYSLLLHKNTLTLIVLLLRRLVLQCQINKNNEKYYLIIEKLRQQNNFVLKHGIVFLAHAQISKAQHKGFNIGVYNYMRVSLNLSE